MKRLAFGFPLAVAICTASAAFGQQSVQTVRELYASAAYEEALAAVARMQPQPEIEQYRVFSLTALGRREEAQKVMESLIQADPMYLLNPEETPPRVQEAFNAVRQRLLPTVAKRVYLDARASLERKDRAQAIKEFERVLQIIDAAGPAAESVADLRVLASGFLDLSKALPVETPAAAQAAGRSAPAGERPVPDSAAPAPAVVEATRPVAIKQPMPAWLPPDAVARRATFTGLIQIRIGADGRVEGAEIVRASHPAYDALLLRAARGWVYEPAKRNGLAVASELNVEVNLSPPQE